MNETIKEELTMNAVPKAVNYLIEEVAEMRALLDKMEKQLGLGVNRHRPILIEQAAEILQMKTGTVRRLVNDRAIPHYKTVGSGELKFECDEYEQHRSSSFTKCVAQDTKHSKIEDKIEHIIEVLEKVADNRDERARQRELEEERREQLLTHGCSVSGKFSPIF